MPDYRVRWEIDVEADSPEEAIREALSIMRDPDSIAHCFSVWREGEKRWTEFDLQVNECRRCGTALKKGRCLDETCPFSDHDQTCPVGWISHPAQPSVDNGNCRCAGKEKL